MLYSSSMFTGIIEAKGAIQAVGDGQLTITRPSLFRDVDVGSSISVAGVCLTVTMLDADSMTFDVVGETLKKSTIGALRTGSQVNLERAMQTGDRFEGHVVQGHTEGVGEVTSISVDGIWTVMTIRLSEELRPMVIAKGSIAIDGVSLTVASVDEHTCRIALIPQTLRSTTLGELREGDTVNIETDVLGRYVRSLVADA